jgi:DNA-binding transcriptional regulator YhcF (GntR family)
VLPLTQEFLSQMLGVNRTTVTLVARQLERAGLIQNRRGASLCLTARASKRWRASATPWFGNACAPCCLKLGIYFELCSIPNGQAWRI